MKKIKSIEHVVYLPIEVIEVVGVRCAVVFYKLYDTYKFAEERCKVGQTGWLDDGYCYITYSKIVERYRISKDRVRVCLRTLESVGMVTRREASGRHGKLYYYKINEEKLNEILGGNNEQEID